MGRKVIKIRVVDNPIVEKIYNGSYLLNNYYYKWEPGKVALSVKVGKKRKLITGKIESVPISCRDSGLYYEHYLISNSRKLGLLVPPGIYLGE